MSTNSIDPCSIANQDSLNQDFSKLILNNHRNPISIHQLSKLDSIQKVDLDNLIDHLKAIYRTYNLAWIDHCDAIDRLKYRLNRKKRTTPTPSSAHLDLSSVGLQINDSTTISSNSIKDHNSNNLSNLIQNGRTTRRTANSTTLGLSDAVTDAQFDIVLAHLGTADQKDPNIRAMKTTAIVPDMIFFNKDRKNSISQDQQDDDDTLVKDPIEFYQLNQSNHHHHHQNHQSNWTKEEQDAFESSYSIQPKQFGWIASQVKTKTRAECVLHYYLTKRDNKYRNLHSSNPPIELKPKEIRGKRNKKVPFKPQISNGSSSSSSSSLNQIKTKTKPNLNLNLNNQNNQADIEADEDPLPIEPTSSSSEFPSQATSTQNTLIKSNNQHPSQISSSHNIIANDSINKITQSSSNLNNSSSISSDSPSIKPKSAINSSQVKSSISTLESNPISNHIPSTLSNSQSNFHVIKTNPNHQLISPQSQSMSSTVEESNYPSEAHNPSIPSSQSTDRAQIISDSSHSDQNTSRVSKRRKMEFGNTNSNHSILSSTLPLSLAKTKKSNLSEIQSASQYTHSTSKSSTQDLIEKNTSEPDQIVTQFHDHSPLEDNQIKATAELSTEPKNSTSMIMSIKETTSSENPVSRSSMQIRNLLNDDPVEPSTTMSNMDATAWFGADQDEESLVEQPLSTQTPPLPKRVKPQKHTQPEPHSIFSKIPQHRPLSRPISQPSSSTISLLHAHNHPPSEFGVVHAYNQQHNDTIAVDERFADPPSLPSSPSNPSSTNNRLTNHHNSVSSIKPMSSPSQSAARATLPQHLRHSSIYLNQERPISFGYYPPALSSSSYPYISPQVHRSSSKAPLFRNSHSPVGTRPSRLATLPSPISRRQSNEKTFHNSHAWPPSSSKPPAFSWSTNRNSNELQSKTNLNDIDSAENQNHYSRMS
ncbi:hypothetical protein O181_075833 [Austropuccinia psidii MF-1]|uniref:SANT domain-containing protein n=1 Tax=Austropuccinia psidii MF-1 TaxID=1389203 RepID=A0A9Q3F9N4_9BASI|nr:hypothetical protein [Austropuccinia psidii MF-1]